MLTNINIILRKELKSYFNSPMAYIFLVVFAIVTGYFFTNTFFLFNQSNMRALFNIVPLVYLFFIPAITMGLIAREKNIGTMEVMSTLPIKDVEFVVGKFLSALILIALGLGFTLIHFITLVNVGTNIDYGAVFTGYLGLLMLGSVYASVGTFASSVTENQVIAFIIADPLPLFVLLNTILSYRFLFSKRIFFVPSVEQSSLMIISRLNSFFC